MTSPLPRLLKPRWAAIAVAIGALALPGQALALRYASPSGSSSNDCLTPATACDLETAIEGDGGSNVPTNGEEVIVLTGTYTMTTNIIEGAPNLNVHGDFGGARPTIDATASGRLDRTSGTLSYMTLVGSVNTPVNISGTTLTERVLIRGTYNGSTAVCQCYGGTVRNSVFVSTGTAPALGVASNGGSANVTYRNVTAYSTNASGSAIGAIQVAMSGTLVIDAYNAIALNTAGGADILADGPDSTITLSRSNYRAPSTADGGVVQDAPGEPHQTALPLFTNPATFDFSEQLGSPTIDAGLTGSEYGPFDFAGNPRSLGGGTDIGAYEYLPPLPPVPIRTPAAPTFRVASKARIKRSGKGRLGFGCTSPGIEPCTVVGTLTAGGAAKKRAIGQVSGKVPAESNGTVLIKLNKIGRKRLAAKQKLRASLSGQVSNATGQSSSLAASITLKQNR